MRPPQPKAASAWRRVCTLVASLVVAGAGGCGGGSVEISMTPLAGRIGGASWMLASAESSAFLSDGSPTFFVTAYSESLTACTDAGGSATGNELILNIPKNVGDYSLAAFSLTETFYVRGMNSNLVATSGRMRVDQVTDTSITGGAHFSFDTQNEVDGLFTATLCPP